MRQQLNYLSVQQQHLPHIQLSGDGDFTLKMVFLERFLKKNIDKPTEAAFDNSFTHKKHYVYFRNPSRYQEFFLEKVKTILYLQFRKEF